MHTPLPVWRHHHHHHCHCIPDTTTTIAMPLLHSAKTEYSNNIQLFKNGFLQSSGGGEFPNLAPCFWHCSGRVSGCSGTLLQHGRGPLKVFWRSWQNLSAFNGGTPLPPPPQSWPQLGLGLLVNPGLAAPAAACCCCSRLWALFLLWPCRTLSARQPNLSPSPNLPTKASSFPLHFLLLPIFSLLLHFPSSLIHSTSLLIVSLPSMATWLFNSASLVFCFPLPFFF